MHSSHILSIPLIAQTGDLAGELGQVLVGAALVVADDLHQALAHVDEPVVGSAGAHHLGALGADDLLRVARLGAGNAPFGRDPDRAIVRRVGLVAFGAQFLGPVLGTASSP